jgi:hypothetical protein
MIAMTPTLKTILTAVFWFVLGHISCAALHHLHRLAK